MVSKSQRTAQRWVLDDLHTVANKPIGDIGEYLRIYGKNIWLRWWASNILAEFSPRWVKVWKNWLILPIQVSQTIKDRNFSVQQILLWLNTTDISLNHLWVRYKVLNKNEEVERITEFMQGDRYSLFEDPTGKEHGMKWLFIWLEDPKNPWKPRMDLPMFEIVLIENTSELSPHVQLDVDTILAADNIQTRVQQVMRLPKDKDPFSFHLDVPNRVLSMGTYNNKNWFSHEIGIGTNLRSREAHRDSMVLLT